MKVGTPDDAKSIVRKYIVGTRSRHGKIVSITMSEEIKGPDEKGVWTLTGSFVTEDGDTEQFAASVTSRGEVLMAPFPSKEAKGKTTARYRR